MVKARVWCSGAIVAATLGAPGAASATGPAPTVEWRWDRFTPDEGAVTLAATVGGWVFDRRFPDYQEPRMDFEVPLLDPGVRGLVRARTAEGQAIWARWGDIGFRTLVLFPYIVDAGVVALGIHHDVDVAAQLFFIDLQSFTLAGLTQLVVSRVTSRTRPYVQDCADDGLSTRHPCGESREHRSFHGGHASAAFTSAGLTCLHHQNLPLYGGGAADTWACVWALTFASLTSVSRVVADEHWASDTLVGIATGWLYGYLLPKWLHYDRRHVGPATSSPSDDRGLKLRGWVPQFRPSHDGGVLALTARF